MQFVFLGLLALAAALGLGWVFVNTDPRVLLRTLRFAAGGAMVLLAIILFVARQWGIAAALGFAGVTLLARGRLGPLDLGGSVRSDGRRSAVRSRYLEMELDHDSGVLNGAVRDGAFAGRRLDDLDEAELQRLYTELAADADSVSLMEVYLDRRFPGWREHREEDTAAGPRGATQSGAMTDEEAYEILGLSPGAGPAEIHSAHRRLMKGVHPDQGGSTFLAAKINQARDRLLGRHR